jgi:hypothetical protein
VLLVYLEDDGIEKLIPLSAQPPLETASLLAGSLAPVKASE